MNDTIKYRFHIKYKNEKFKFLLFSFLLLVVLFLAYFLLSVVYARYEMAAKINADIDKAIYIIDAEKISFNLEPQGIVPRDEAYTYRFSVCNFKGNVLSDMDISYKVKVRTTTNLPIQIKMYRNELPSASATNILGSAVSQQDSDLAWYRLYTSQGEYQLPYTTKTTDIYTLEIKFPTSYATNPIYANYLESIEIIIDSKQVI